MEEDERETEHTRDDGGIGGGSYASPQPAKHGR